MGLRLGLHTCCSRRSDPAGDAPVRDGREVVVYWVHASNVLRTHDLVDVGGGPVLSMEYVDGLFLKALLDQRGALPLGAGLRVAKGNCHGLDAAHRAGVVHRDVKPQNVTLDPETAEVKIMDFGIARLSQAGGEGVTAAGTVFGSPDYMAPEQAQGPAADARTDVYALGATLFEMFTGRVPFVADSAMAVLMKHVNHALPEALDAVILACLQKDPSRRPQTVGEVLDRLSRVAAGTDTGRVAA